MQQSNERGVPVPKAYKTAGVTQYIRMEERLCLDARPSTQDVNGLV